MVIPKFVHRENNTIRKNYFFKKDKFGGLTHLNFKIYIT